MTDAIMTDSATASTPHLPNEVKTRIANYLDPAALKNLRLSVAWDTQATETLFRGVELRPTTQSVEDTANVLSSSRLKVFVRDIKFNTASKPSYVEELRKGGYFTSEKAYNAVQEFSEALAHIGVRPLDRSPSRHITTSPSGSNITANASPSQHTGQSAPEKSDTKTPNTEMLSVIMDRLIASLKDPEQVVNYISVQSVQCRLPEKPSVETDFQTTLARVDSIEAYIHTADRMNPAEQYELDSSGDETLISSATEDPRPKAFFKTALNKFIISPFAKNLSELKLYSDVYWGMQPCCDLRNLHLPALKRLTFGKLMLFADWQLEFFAGLKTMEELVLNDCPIIFYGSHVIGWENPQDHPARPAISPHPVNLDSFSFEYAGRWDQFFQTFKDDLPKLHHFSLGQAGLSLSRYCVYYSERVLLPKMEGGDVIWPRHDCDGGAECDHYFADYPFENDEPDERAFDELMEAVDGQRG